jgi:hypothetical protein
LISLGQLCDNNCIAIFTKQKMHVYKDKTCVLSGTRNHRDGLWDIPLATPISPSLSIAPMPSLASNAIIRRNMPTLAANAIIRKDMKKLPSPNNFTDVAAALSCTHGNER